MDLINSLLEYHDKFITAFFISGFTIGSFLFSMKAVIVKTLKDEVFDHVEYEKEVLQKKELGLNISYYTELINFSNLIMQAIVWSYISAISHVTIGHFGNIFTTIICLLISLISWVILGKSIYFVHLNWKKAFQFAENIKSNNSKFNTKA